MSVTSTWTSPFSVGTVDPAITWGPGAALVGGADDPGDESGGAEEFDEESDEDAGGAAEFDEGAGGGSASAGLGGAGADEPIDGVYRQIGIRAATDRTRAGSARFT
ncbi:hypothetical protein [Streptomyces sp. NBC_01255]|uniref:hypothetical protein n=1 Tax=Streptomyces sp. NBC_01255 TaxID=2903798 RepID=UPI002E367AB5|nr:hypothetical protein [Streptomyces sp. NBC_01255]